MLSSIDYEQCMLVFLEFGGRRVRGRSCRSRGSVTHDSF